MVNGLINECGKIQSLMVRKNWWFDVSTLRNLIGEGKTMGLD